jgi:hypothetical protein
MAQYTKDKRPVLLERGDTVIFQFPRKALFMKGDTITYSVRNNHMSNSNGDNDQIFEALGLNSDDKFALAKLAYGPQDASYSSNHWPECTSGRYEGLTKLVNYLFDLLERKVRYESLPAPEPPEDLKEVVAALQDFTQCRGAIADVIGAYMGKDLKAYMGGKIIAKITEI